MTWEDEIVPTVHPLAEETKKEPELALLAAGIDRCGFYPDLVLDSMKIALATQPLLGHLIHHEATFTSAQVHRHLTVLALTPTRLMIGHTDEHQVDNRTQAISSVEAISLKRLYSVVLSRVVQDPEKFSTGDSVLFETWLTLGWGSMRRLEVEPAGCGDAECVAEHGFLGTDTADDLTIRMSDAADGPESSAALVRFAALLQQTIGELQ